MSNYVQLKKGEDRRIRGGHPWIYSNEINTTATPLKAFQPGEEVIVQAHDKTLLGAAYVNPHSLIAGRIFSRNPEEKLDVAFFTRQIQQALQIRQRIFEKPFYRLIFSEVDGIPGLVVDRFGDDLVAQVNTAGLESKIAEIVDALRAVLPNTRSILLRNDSSIRTQEGLEAYTKAGYGTPNDEIIIEENGVKFAVPLLEGQKTGWFYDHRMNRARLKDYVKDKTVLDVFSYLGGWGIQAASWGATSVECIEASAFACEYINKNAALNQVEKKVSTICDDAFQAMKALVQAGKQYDVIIVDPPAFVKRFKDRKEGLIAYQRINELALRLLGSDGILVSCSCSMHVGADDLLQLLQRAAFRSQTSLQILERGHQGPDHPIHLLIPETDYLKAIILRKIEG